MMNMQNNGTSSCREMSLKDKLKAVSFSLYETVLYLDVYPNNTTALEHYNMLMEELEEITEQYEKKYGPITIYGNEGDSWKWINCPWPWESEAN
ncbi:MAG: spore coat protein CotJB [Clostridia bacterium]|nr:spore coat protein CotJB [Clostridia bacterium]